MSEYGQSGKATKKPVEIEFRRWDGTGGCYQRLNRWSGGAFRMNEEQSAGVRTLEGFMYADIGDVIIKGVQGEFYPRKPSIFEATYDITLEEL